MYVYVVLYGVRTSGVKCITSGANDKPRVPEGHEWLSLGTTSDAFYSTSPEGHIIILCSSSKSSKTT